MEITDRRQFGKLCESRGYKRGVEIGTDRADFAVATLQGWPSCEEFWCFDPYEPVEQSTHPYDRLADLVMASVRLAPFVPTVRIVRLPGAAGPGVMSIYGIRPQFVYIDALHTYEPVRQDIETWWPYLMPGGILAGHDYANTYAPGVVRAVDEFVSREGLSMHQTSEQDGNWSWWVEKP